MNRIASAKYLDGSRGQHCTLRIVGVCNHNAETTVPAHIRDRHKAGGTKASDISVANACYSCHAKFDGHLGEPLSREDWLFYALRGLQETLEQRISAGLLVMPMDAPKPYAVKARKPVEDRQKIQSRKDAWPKRSFPKREKP